MLATKAHYCLTPRVEMGTDAVVGPTDSTGVFLFATRKAIHPIEHVIKTANVGKHRMFLVPSDVLAVQFAVVIHLDRDHPGASDDALLLVHHDLCRFFPTTNNPFSVLIESHRHGFSPFVT